ncbi:MAG: type III secretion system chaperone [Zoogloeaceae bacterium]|jgi:hypothetical protein|nr:type III secretion system chaperone [Zoogloeaceae bacterium]
MSVSHIARSALEDFRERHGLSLHWEKDAVYEVTTDFGFCVRLFAEEESGLIRAWTALCPEAPEEARASVHAALLEANLADSLVFGGSLALEPETLAIVYQRAYDPRQGGASGFSRFFLAFAETASGLQGAVAALVADEADAPVFSGAHI